MKILVTGDEGRIQALKQQMPDSVTVEVSQSAPKTLEGYDALFDLNLDDQPENLTHYKNFEGKPVFGNAVKMQLAAMAHLAVWPLKCHLFGLNALPTFLERNVKEVSSLYPKDAELFNQWAENLGWDYQLVNDRVGMVSPRVILMIINEAAYTLQEGTANQTDINKSLKLGTNYPYGPFEWADKIGIKDVYESLYAIYQDTLDERYKICPLLKTHYFKGTKFGTE